MLSYATKFLPFGFQIVLVTLKFCFCVIGGTRQTDAPLKLHKNILAFVDEIFRFKLFGAHSKSMITSFYKIREFNCILTRSQIHTILGDYSLIVAAKLESGLIDIFETPTLGRSVDS